MDWSGLTKERIDLELPLLLVKGQRGFLSYDYMNVSTCKKTGAACADYFHTDCDMHLSCDLSHHDED